MEVESTVPDSKRDESLARSLLSFPLVKPWVVG